MKSSILPFSLSFRVIEKFASLLTISAEFISVTEIDPSSEQAMRWPPESRVTAYDAWLLGALLSKFKRSLCSGSILPPGLGCLPLLADE